MNTQTFLRLLGILIIVGVAFWAVDVAPFIDASIKVLIKIVVVVAGAFWLLRLLGML